MDRKNEKEAILSAVFLNMLAGYDLSVDINGIAHPASKEKIVETRIEGAVNDYELKAHPVVRIPLKDRWLELLKETWEEIVSTIKMTFRRK